MPSFLVSMLNVYRVSPYVSIVDVPVLTTLFPEAINQSKDSITNQQLQGWGGECINFHRSAENPEWECAKRHPKKSQKKTDIL